MRSIVRWSSAEDDSPTKEFVLRCRDDDDNKAEWQQNDEDEDENISNAADANEILGFMIKIRRLTWRFEFPPSHVSEKAKS
jgi:hypothetical protein